MNYELLKLTLDMVRMKPYSVTRSCHALDIVSVDRCPPALRCFSAIEALTIAYSSPIGVFFMIIYVLKVGARSLIVTRFRM